MIYSILQMILHYLYILFRALTPLLPFAILVSIFCAMASLKCNGLRLLLLDKCVDPLFRVISVGIVSKRPRGWGLEEASVCVCMYRVFLIQTPTWTVALVLDIP